MGGKLTYVKETLGRGPLRIQVELPQKALDPRAPVPAHDPRRDLVTQREHEHGRVARQRPNLCRDIAADGVHEPSVVQERHVLRPGEADHHPQSVPVGIVQQTGTRRRVHANAVEAELRHLAEVVGNTPRRRELAPAHIGCEGAVAHALHQKAHGSGAQKLAVGDHAGGGAGVARDEFEHGHDAAVRRVKEEDASWRRIRVAERSSSMRRSP